MKIILKENIENLGNKGDIISVAAGYGRNYLLPKKLALEVTSSNMKMIEMEQAALKKHLEKARESYQDVIQKISDLSFSFKRKAGEKDTIFGSVSVTDIKEELEKLGFEIEKKKILLKEPIKRLGNYTVPIKVFLDDIAEIKVQVLPEGAEEDIKPVDGQAKEEPKEKKPAEKAEVKKEEEPKEELRAKKPIEETVVEESMAKTPDEKKLDEAAPQEDKKAVQSDPPSPGAEEKPDPEPEVEVKKEEKEVQKEEAAAEKTSSEETVKTEEKVENNEKNKTSQ